MAESKTYNGYVYTRSAPGQPWTLQGPAQAGGVVAGNPTVLANANEDQQFQRNADQREAAKDARTIARSDAELPYVASKAQADAAKAQADAAKARLEAEATAAAQAGKANPQVAEAANKLGLDEVLSAIERARKDVSGWSTGMGGQMLKGWGGSQARDLSGDLSTIGSHLTIDKLKDMKAQSATGASGMGALSEKEGALLRDSVAGLDQLQSKDKVLESLAQVEMHYRRLQAITHGQNPDDPKVAQAYGLAMGPPVAGGKMGGAATGSSGGGSSGPTPGSAPSSGGGTITADGRFAPDPALAGANAHVGALIRAGKSADEVRRYLDSLRPGLGAQAGNVDQAVAYARQHPGDKSDWLNLDLEKTWQPASGLSQTLGKVGMSPVGTAAIGAADMLSMGALDNMTGNPAMTRAVQGGLQQENPVAYALGQIGGGALSGVGIEAALARAGMTGVAASRIGDALLGAGYGAGSADEPGDSRIAAALLGSGEGVIGGMAGRGAARTIGRAATGVQDAAVRGMNAAGIRMTPGQMMGGAVKGIEDRLSGYPLVGDAINLRRSEGLRDFNQTAFQQALDPINGTTNNVIGAPGIDIARQVRSDAYSNALDPVTVQADGPFVQDMRGVIAQGDQLPEPMRSNAQYTLPTRVGNSFGQNGELTGNAYQQSLRGLRRDASSMENQPYGYDFAEVTRGAEGALEGLLERQSPGTVDALRAANEANRNVETLRAAVNAARNGTRSHQVDVFMPSQLSDAAASSAKKYGNSAGTTNQPFYQLTRDAQSVLPGSVPDSGTAGRAVIPLAIGATAGGVDAASEDGDAGHRATSGAGTAAIAAALAAAPYSAPARATIQRLLMAERPQVIQDLGATALANQRIANLLATPGALIYANGQ